VSARGDLAHAVLARHFRQHCRAAIAAFGFLAGSPCACSSNPPPPLALQTSLVAATPQGGTTGVNPTASIRDAIRSCDVADDADVCAARMA
jgi:hypothetical protein